MSEKELAALVEELRNNRIELYNFIAHSLEDAEDDEIDKLVEELQNSTLDLREFVIQTLQN